MYEHTDRQSGFHEEEEEEMLRSRGDEKEKQGKEAKCLRNPQKSVLRVSDVNPSLSVLHYYSWKTEGKAGFALLVSKAKPLMHH